VGDRAGLERWSGVVRREPAWIHTLASGASGLSGRSSVHGSISAGILRIRPRIRIPSRRSSAGRFRSQRPETLICEGRHATRSLCVGVMGQSRWPSSRPSPRPSHHRPSRGGVRATARSQVGRGSVSKPVRSFLDQKAHGGDQLSRPWCFPRRKPDPRWRDAGGRVRHVANAVMDAGTYR